MDTLPAARKLSRLPHFKGRDRLTAALVVAGGRRAVEVDDGVVVEIEPRDGISRALALGSDYLAAMGALLTRLAEPGMVCVDVGANIGYTALAMGRKARTVYAFEPGADAYRQLVRNTELNGYDVRPVNLACGDRNGSAELHTARVSTEYSSLKPTWLGLAGTTETVTTVRLDQWLPEPPDLVKVDVEGAEWDVLRGLEGFLPGPTLVLETHLENAARFGYTPGELLAWLERMGYEIERLAGDAVCRYR